MVSQGEIADNMIRAFLLVVSISLIALAAIILVVDVLTAPARGKEKAGAEIPAPDPASPEVGRRWSGRRDPPPTDAVRPSPDGMTRANGSAPEGRGQAGRPESGGAQPPPRGLRW
jgi:hypothetical protein